jgi:hypothetical protein
LRNELNEKDNRQKARPRRAFFVPDLRRVLPESFSHPSFYLWRLCRMQDVSAPKSLQLCRDTDVPEKAIALKHAPKVTLFRWAKNLAHA